MVSIGESAMPRKFKQYTNPFLKARAPLAAPSYSTLPNLQSAIELHQQGRLGQAEAIYLQLLETNPRNADALHLLGVIASQTGNNQAAVDLISQAIEINPNLADYHSNQGNALQELKQLEAAVASFDKAIELKPDYAEAYSNRGLALQELKQLDAAVDSCEKAIKLKPDYAEAYYNRGNALKELKQLDTALASYNNAIALKPDYAKAYSNRGLALNELNQLEAAVASYDKAIELKPDFAEAYSNLGNALQELKQLDPAAASFDKAIELKPDFAEAYYNRGLLRLLLREFYNGFLDYRYRWDTKDILTKPQKTTIPSASKSGLKGRLLIWAEQGLGDEIFYAGLLPQLSTVDVSITLSADKRLHPIYRRSFPKIDLLDKDILKSSSVDTGFDAQAPIGDLGFLLDINASAIQATRSTYLMSDHVKRDSYRKTISAMGSGLVCGVAWKSISPNSGTAKSIGLASFAPLLGLPGVHFVSLQYGDVKEEIQHVKSTLSVVVHQVPDIDVFYNVDGLLALIDACDVIVTTSNVTAHLAGSIGKRAAVLLPHSKGKIWYWHHNDEHSFWYPSLRLFYQDNPLTWDQTIEDCADWFRGQQ
jgi:tetratricopeptide (TPR) repeat protein